ncbi:MAG: dihydropteroate synthase [Rickettsiaceae bacterium]
MIYLSLGSNLGNRFANLLNAISIINTYDIKVLYQSIIIETRAILPNDAPLKWNKNYLNMVIIVQTSYLPIKLLSVLQEIEVRLGRVKSKYWSPRIIDLDILLYNDLVFNSDILTIPHKELLNRDFLIHLISLINPMQKYYYSNNDNNRVKKTFAQLAENIDKDSLFTRSLASDPKFVGVLNLTPDSFSDGGQYYNDIDEAFNKALELAENGATIIDIGAQSTRPNAFIINTDEELNRLIPLLDRLYQLQKSEGYKCEISIDSFNPRVIEYILEKYTDISWINCVSGNLPKSLLRDIANAKIGIIAMHSNVVPVKQGFYIDQSQSATNLLKTWCLQIYESIIDAGFCDDNIILDPGIGFGKSAYQSLDIIRNISYLKSELQCKILAGHSRKSFINSFYPSDIPSDRDLETISISNELAQSGVDYLRIHNIKSHQRFFVAQKSAKM